MPNITEDEQQHLYDNFETRDLLDAVDSIDVARSYLSDGLNFSPPEIRNDIMKLHEYAMQVINHGQTDNIDAMFELADDIEAQVNEVIEALTPVRETLDKLTLLYPESLAKANGYI